VTTCVDFVGNAMHVVTSRRLPKDLYIGFVPMAGLFIEFHQMERWFHTRMIEIIGKGSIFESECDMIVNPVNIRGTMGKGLAKEFRERYPSIWAPYYQKCHDGWNLGEVLVLQNPNEEFPKWICCFPTKIHWSHPSKMWIIWKSMTALFNEIAYTGIKSIALPAIGCGLGGLKWDAVKKYLLEIPWPEFLEVKIYEPNANED
jgi:O-acetyl-ADP-ribose deacetylase (regulator of RNase III)